MMETISGFLLTFLLNAIWQITLIPLIAYTCSRILSKTSANIQHRLWVIAIIFALGLPILTSADLLNTNWFSRNYFQSQAVPIKPLVNTNFQQTTEENLTPPQNVVQKEASYFTFSGNFSLILLSLYLLILIYGVFNLLRAWKQTQLIRKTTFLREHSDDILEVLKECQTVFKVKNVRILYSSKVNSPMALGVLNPLIILPAQFLEETNRDILLSAIGHELVHIKRQDCLFNLFYELIYLPISFHPATKLMKRRIRETRELRCDEVVTEKLLCPRLYAQSLVQLTSAAIDFGRQTTLSIGISDGEILEKRIMKILEKNEISGKRRNFLLVMASILMIAAFVVAISMTIHPVIAQQQTKLDDKQPQTKLDDKQPQTIEDGKLLDKIKAEEQELVKKKRLAELEQKAKVIYDSGNYKKEDLEILLKTKEKLELELQMKSQPELAKLAKVSMSQAIETATNQQPGTVLECKLVLAKLKSANGDSPAFYKITISTEKEVKIIFVNAADGTITDPKNFIE